MNDAKPSDKMVPQRRMSGFMRERRRWNGASLPFTRYQITGTPPTPWPMMVANAEPATPKPIHMTSTKFMTMHTTVPSTLVPNANMGLPSVRRKLFAPMPMHWKTKPTMRIWTKVLARSCSSGVVPTSARIGSIKTIPASAMMAAMMMSSSTVLPTVRSTLSILSSPSWMAASALPPWPAKADKPISRIMMGNASVVTAMPISPTA